MKPPPENTLLIVVSAPSGAGKTTLCQALLTEDARLTRAITCTTRLPRPGEQDGVDYYFLTETVFRERVAQGAFLEHATVHGHSYGTLESEVWERWRSGRDVLLTIDVQGAASVRARARSQAALGRALCTIFLVPPSLEALAERLRKRAQDPEDEIQRRLAGARAELAQWTAFDYVVTTDTVPQAVKRMRSIIEAEHLRQWRVRPPEL